MKFGIGLNPRKTSGSRGTLNLEWEFGSFQVCKYLRTRRRESKGGERDRERERLLYDVSFLERGLEELCDKWYNIVLFFFMSFVLVDEFSNYLFLLTKSCH